MIEFLPAVSLSLLKEGDLVPAQVGGVHVVLYLVDGTLYCTEDRCSHEDNFLSDGGYVERDQVECAYHGARFNLKTGEPIRFPADYPIRTYPVQVRDGHVYVAIR